VDGEADDEGDSSEENGGGQEAGHEARGKPGRLAEEGRGHRWFNDASGIPLARFRLEF
jgi:hypothetical protein